MSKLSTWTHCTKFYENDPAELMHLFEMYFQACGWWWWIYYVVQQNAGCFVITTALHMIFTKINQLWVSHPIRNSHVKDDVSDHNHETNIHIIAHGSWKTKLHVQQLKMWILSSVFPRNSTCRSTQWEHAFWASISVMVHNWKAFFSFWCDSRISS